MPKNVIKVGVLAIVATISLLGALAVQATVVVPQQAFAQPTGCSPGHSGPGEGFFSSGKKCFHTPGNG
jgi:hypothetical protein